MAYNITIADNITGVQTALGFVNVNGGGLFFMLLLLVLTIIIALTAIRNNVREFKAIFFSLSITLVPMVLLAAMSAFSVPFIPAWYIVLHLTLMAISGVFAYLEK